MSAARRWGDPPPRLAPILKDVDWIRVELEDEHEREHLAFVQHHPAFPEALEGLRGDYKLGGVEEASPHLIEAAIADPRASANAPAREFAKDWGITTAAALYLALQDPVSVDTDYLAVEVTELEYVVHIPRPLTPARRNAICKWVKSENRPGPAEEAWGKAGKQRWDPSPRASAAIAWFQRWNAGEEPAQIYRDVSKEAPVAFETFHSSLVSAWKRMKAISPDKVREERPSKASV
ncbi:MAG: hypothetical protein U0R51_08250 [Solirubrobacterales bacterium]